MKKRTKIVLTGLGLVFGAGLTYVGWNGSQIRNAYNIANDSYQVGNEAIARKITKDNLSNQKNQDISQKIKDIEDRMKEHNAQYGFNSEDGFDLKDIPTWLGVEGVMIKTGGAYAKTGKYMRDLVE